MAPQVTPASGFGVSSGTMRHVLTVVNCLMHEKQNDLVLAKDAPKYSGVNENHHSISDGSGKNAHARRKMSNRTSSPGE